MLLPFFFLGAFWGSPPSGALRTDHPTSNPAIKALTASPGHTGSCPSPALLCGCYYLPLPYMLPTYLSRPDSEAGTLLCPLKVPDSSGTQALSTPFVQSQGPSGTSPTSQQQPRSGNSAGHQVQKTDQSLSQSTQPVCKGLDQAKGSHIRDQELSSHPGDVLPKAR